MLKTVIFDLGKVLVEFDYNVGMQKIGFSNEAQEIFRKNIFSGLWEEMDRYAYNDGEIRKIFKDAVPGYETEVDMLWDNLYNLTGVYDYSDKWIDDLHNLGIKVYILSNYGRRSYEINSEKYTFLKKVDGEVISWQTGMVKPEPGIYKTLLEKYDIVPEESVFVDDRQSNVDGAIEMGIGGILFTSYEDANRQIMELLKN